jgi:hypothetical protein
MSEHRTVIDVLYILHPVVPKKGHQMSCLERVQSQAGGTPRPEFLMGWTQAAISQQSQAFSSSRVEVC